MHMPRPPQLIDGREADEKLDFILVIFSFNPPPPSRFPVIDQLDPATRAFPLRRGQGTSLRWAFLAGPLAGAGMLVGATPFGRRTDTRWTAGRSYCRWNRTGFYEHGCSRNPQ